MAAKHYIIAFVVVCLIIGSCIWVYPAWDEYGRARSKNLELKQRILDYEAENEHLRAEIHKLQTDPRAIERVAREKFGWCRPNEKIYDFGD